MNKTFIYRVVEVLIGGEDDAHLVNNHKWRPMFDEVCDDLYGISYQCRDENDSGSKPNKLSKKFIAELNEIINEKTKDTDFERSRFIFDTYCHSTYAFNFVFVEKREVTELDDLIN